MALYELRTYQVYVGKMKDAMAAYQDYGWPAIQKGGLTASLLAISPRTLVACIKLCICGNLTIIMTAASTGIRCFRIRPLWNLPEKSGHCW